MYGGAPYYNQMGHNNSMMQHKGPGGGGGYGGSGGKGHGGHGKGGKSGKGGTHGQGTGGGHN